MVPCRGSDFDDCGPRYHDDCLPFYSEAILNDQLPQNDWQVGDPSMPLQLHACGCRTYILQMPSWALCTATRASAGRL